VAGRTLLQRAAPPEALAVVFGVLEAGAMAALALGSLLVPALIALGGARAASIGLGALLPLAALLAGRRLLAVDGSATVPIFEISLLRSVGLFAPLGAPALEALARQLGSLEVAAGTAVIREGEPDDLFYVISSGEVEVSSGGRLLRQLGRGEGFGELALLLDLPRTADVVATAETSLYSLGKEAFVTSVTGHPASAQVAARLIGERVPAE
jgi:hypothetical protein